MAGGVRVWDLRDCKHVVIPEGVEKIDKYWFWGSSIESVMISTGVKEIYTDAFRNCKKLKRVIFAKGSQLEKIGEKCFRGSGIEEITIPKSVKDIDEETFYGCENLQIIYVEDGCAADFCWIKISDSTKVGPLPETMAGSEKVWDLRNCKHAIIPVGVEKIENNWFWGSDIECVTISASIREIGDNAFRNCKRLK